MFPFDINASIWRGGGQMLSGRWRRRYEAVINSTPNLFWPLFTPSDTIPVYDPPPTGDGHIYVQFTVTSSNALVKHVLVSSLSKRRVETHWKAFWWRSHITPAGWSWWSFCLTQSFIQALRCFKLWSTIISTTHPEDRTQRSLARRGLIHLP